MRRFILSVAALAALAMPAAAQKAGRVEVGVFGRWTKYDDSYALADNYFGVGGRLGVFVARNLEIEAQGSWHAPASSRVLYDPSGGGDTGVDDVDVISGRLLLEYDVPLGPFALILGAGGAVKNYGGAANDLLVCPAPQTECQVFDPDTGDPLGTKFGPTWGDGTTEFGPVGLVGLRLGRLGRFDARVDFTYEWIPTPADRMSNADDASHIGVNAGLSLLLGSEKPKDADLDGVADKLDKCPNTAAGMAVDAAGCPLDDDKDGVINATDICPNTPAGDVVDASGCSANQKDDDRDGVMNAKDKCPNTPAGTKVDANGCPMDADGDGVNDAADRCPNTPKGETVDGNGCSASQRDTDGDGVRDDKDRCPSTQPGTTVDDYGCRKLSETGALVLSGVTFATGKATLTPNSKTILDQVIAKMQPYFSEVPSTRVEVGGHTDNTGSRATNTRLSQLRAETVMKYFIAGGIDPSRLTAKGYGPDQPVADNTSKAGREQNRRVQLTPLY